VLEPARYESDRPIMTQMMRIIHRNRMVYAGLAPSQTGGWDRDSDNK
jgi:hypothetical protein